MNLAENHWCDWRPKACDVQEKFETPGFVEHGGVESDHDSQLSDVWLGRTQAESSQVHHQEEEVMDTGYDRECSEYV